MVVLVLSAGRIRLRRGNIFGLSPLAEHLKVERTIEPECSYFCDRGFPRSPNGGRGLA